MPPGVTLRTGLPQVPGNRGAEFEHPPSNCLIADNEATLRQEVLNIAVAQSEPEIEPDGMPDDVRRKSMPSIGNWLHGSAVLDELAATEPAQSSQCRPLRRCQNGAEGQRISLA
jgi:hypothetical protein